MIAVYALRAVVTLGPVIALLLADVSGPSVPGWLVLMVAVLGVGHGWFVDTAFGTFAAGLVLVWWATATTGLGIPVLLAALALLAAHVAATLLSYGPPGLPVEPASARLWGRRALIMVVPVPVLWALARAVDGVPEPPGVWTAGVISCVVLAAIASIALRPGDADAV